jgi:HSP20 family protein
LLRGERLPVEKGQKSPRRGSATLDVAGSALILSSFEAQAVSLAKPKGRFAMSLIRRDQRGWDPFRELEEMSTRLNRVFGRAAPSSREAMTAFDWIPSINVCETPQAYLLKAELPGIKKEDVKLQLEDGILTLSGERRYEQDHKEEKVHRVETAYGSFMRSFSVPEDASADAIEASYKDGMLTVRMPKLAPEQKKKSTKQIPVS